MTTQTILVRKIEDIPPRQRRGTANHLRALHPTVFDEAIARIRERVEVKGETGVWEIHDHKIGYGLETPEVCTHRCTQVEAVDGTDPRLAVEG